MIKDFLIDHLPPKILSGLRKAHQRGIVLSYYILRVFPIKKNKIVITNYYGKGYGDNGKYIADEIIRRNLGYDLVWILNNSVKDFPAQIRTVRYGSFRSKYEEVTSRVWIDNCRKSSLVRKRKGQFYIQTWHGGVALKRIEKDVENNISQVYIENAKQDSKMADLFISNSKFCTKLYSSAFWYDGPIMECGYPRNDILINPPIGTRNKVLNYFNLNECTRVILYAPTFRADNNMQVYDLNYSEILEVLEEKYDGHWVFLVRLHPNISQKADVVMYSGQVLNATSYDDMQELMVASDILITDYSSSMFEFMLMKKPVFLFSTDLNEYMKDRDLYFNILSLPFPFAENNEKLKNEIIAFNESRYIDAINTFINNVGLLEHGRAAKEIVDKIEAVIGL